jgi:hypothetical protein
MRPFQGMYEKMSFAPYRFQEYPKWVTRKDGSRVVVSDQRQEMAIIAEPMPEAGQATASLEAQNAELAAKLFESEKALTELRAKNDLAKGAVKPAVGPVGTIKAA